MAGTVKEESNDRSFQPKGAIAFFLVMIGFYIALWLFFYFLMLGRR